jgi:uncharacterized protein (TIGR02757 family)
MGFISATLAWGQRPVTIRNCEWLIEQFENKPYQFILNHSEMELERFGKFVHRTFQAEDLLAFLRFFHAHYQANDSLETAFIPINAENWTVYDALTYFHNYFFQLSNAESRTRKHIATPVRGSACKRINMFLRWMVRIDDRGVDFGIWERIKMQDLLCPLDLHVSRTARELGLLNTKQDNWKATIELTESLKEFDANDPVKYDFALFGLSHSGLLGQWE